MTATVRYPLAPLAAHLGIQLGQPGNPNDPHPQGLHALAQQLGVTHRTAQRLHQHGLTEDLIERYVTGILRIHPSDLWPEPWWANAPGEDDHWYSDDPPIDTLDTPNHQAVA